MNQIDEVAPRDNKPDEIITKRFADAMIPGFQAEFKPDEPAIIRGGPPMDVPPFITLNRNGNKPPN